MSSREFDQYWNGAAWLSYGLNRIADDLDEVERLELLEQHERTVQNSLAHRREFDSNAECDMVNSQIELASFESPQQPHNITHPYEHYEEPSPNFYVDDWRFERLDPEDNEYSMIDLELDDFIETEFDPIDSSSATFMRYQRHGKFPGPKTHPEEDEWYEHPGLFLGEDE